MILQCRFGIPLAWQRCENRGPMDGQVQIGLNVVQADEERVHWTKHGL